MALKTPGVYVQEISLLPPSVAEVETAIPAFIGYTEKASKRSEDLTNKPTKISSLLEYREIFGGAFEAESVEVEVDPDNNYAVTEIDVDKRYLYDSLRLFFDNGGGDCYVVSVGNYGDDVELGDEADPDSSPGLRVGLKAIEKVDEPTILLFPDATLLESESEFYSLQQATLTQCARLQDRVAVFDLFEGDVAREHSTSVDNFRNGIGINNLKYGAAYTPWLHATYAREIDFSLFSATVEDDTEQVIDLATVTSDSNLNGLVTAAGTAAGDKATIEANVKIWRGTSATLEDRYKALKDAINAATGESAKTTAFQGLMDFLRTVAGGLAAWNDSLTGTNLARDLDSYAAGTLNTPITNLVALEKNTDVAAFTTAFDTSYDGFDATPWLDADISAIPASETDYDTSSPPVLSDALPGILTELDDIFKVAPTGNILAFIAQVSEAAKTHSEMAQKLLYQEHSIINNIAEHIKRELSRVPPSGAIAGAYAFVDNARGVWKAPANVSLSSVLGPVVPFDDADQEDLNVDVNAGKSINAVRAFSGRGTVVWGARTLAGNDNEWRYVSVRRFFNMVEESVKKSTAFAVFEPNAAPLWTKVKSMISNYLVQKWREGALAGATPEEAFFVNVGLGTTMTAQDILEGRMNVEIGMAVVRPAEFIVLKFSHKLQES